jgi:hypothetical protein
MDGNFRQLISYHSNSAPGKLSEFEREARVEHLATGLAGLTISIYFRETRYRTYVYKLKSCGEQTRQPTLVALDQAIVPPLQFEIHFTKMLVQLSYAYRSKATAAQHSKFN